MKIDTSIPGEEPGIRHARIVKAIEKFSKSSGHPMIELKFVCHDGTEVSDYLVFGGRGKGLALKRLKALGVSTSDPEIDLDPQTLVGRFVRIYLSPETFNGYTSLKIDGNVNDETFTRGYASSREEHWPANCPMPGDAPF